MEPLYLIMAAMIVLMFVFWLAVTGFLVLLACIHDLRSSRAEQPQQREAARPVSRRQPAYGQGAGA